MLKDLIKYVKTIDTLFVIFFFALLLSGAVVQLSASFAIAEFDKKDPYFIFNKHLKMMCGGVVVCFIAFFVPYKSLLYHWGALFVFCFILILVPLLVPYEESQTNRWSPLLVFQPSELVKLVVVCLLAKYYSYCGDKVKGYVQGVIAPILIGGVFCYLIHKGVDLGGAAVVGMIVAMLMFSSGARKSHLMSLLLFVPVVMKAVGSYVYRSDRIIAWQDPWPYASGIGMQIVQSYYAFANGGIFGVGPGKGQQKLFFLPEASTDYIFSIVGEEFGLIGVFFVSSLFLALLWRGFMIARAARTISGYYIALGMTLCVVFPAFFNMLVALSIIPAKGLPLPFFSFGGTSMMVSSLAVGVVLGVHSQSRMESPLAKKVFSV